MGRKTQPKKPVNNGQSITKFCFKRQSQSAGSTAGATGAATAAAHCITAVKAPSKTSSSISSGLSSQPQKGASSSVSAPAPASAEKPVGEALKQAPVLQAAAAAVGGAAGAPVSKQQLGGHQVSKVHKRTSATQQQQQQQQQPPQKQQKPAPPKAPEQKRQAKQSSKSAAAAVAAAAAVSSGHGIVAAGAEGAAAPHGASRASIEHAAALQNKGHEASAVPAGAGTGVRHAAATAAGATRQQQQQQRRLSHAGAAADGGSSSCATASAGATAAGGGASAAGADAARACKPAAPNSRGAAAGASKAAGTASALIAAPPYGGRSSRGRQIVMSQFDDQMEINWEPSPPKLHLALGSTAAAAVGGGARDVHAAAGSRHGGSKSPASKQEQQQQQQRLLQSEHNRTGTGSEHESGTNTQQGNAAAAAGSDELLQQLLGSLSAEPAHHAGSSSSAQVNSSNATALTTPGGPRLRAFRHHSVVPPPSTGGGSTLGDGGSTGGPRRRRPGSALGPAAAAAARMGGANTAAAAARGGGSSSTAKRQQAGVKRKVLLDLLEKVEVMVKRRQGEDGKVLGGDDSPRVLGEDSPGVLQGPVFEGSEGLEDVIDEDGGSGFEKRLVDGTSSDQQHKAAESREHQGSDHQEQQQQLEQLDQSKQAAIVHAVQAAGTSGCILAAGMQQQQQQGTHFATPPPSQTCGAVLKRQEYQQQQQQAAIAAAAKAAELSEAGASVDMVCETPPAAATATAAAAAAVDHVPATPAAAAADGCDDTAVVVVAASPAATPVDHPREILHEHWQQQQQHHKCLQDTTAPMTSGDHTAAAAAAAAAVAAPSTAATVSSQEARALAAAKELEEFALLYSDEDPDVEPAAQPDGQAQQQQQQQRPQLTGAIAPPRLDAENTQQLQLQQKQAGSSNAGRGAAEIQQQQHGLVAAEVGLCGGRRDVYHIVLEVLHEPNEVQLRCFNPYKGTELWVHLSHPWCDCEYAVGDAANIIGGVTTTDAAGRTAVFLHDSQGLLILHPDILLSGTTITTALSCTRKAWLGERFAAAGGGPSAAALQGTLLHELLQKLLVGVAGDDTVPLPGVEALQDMVQEVLSGCGAQLQEVGLTEAAAAQQMSKHLANISAWLRKYLPQRQPQQPWQQQGFQQQQRQQGQQGPQQQQQQQQQTWQQKQQWQQHGQQQMWQHQQHQQQQQQQQPAGGIVDVGPNSGFDQPPRVLIEGVADIEENIWAPRYGLKGQLDASLLVRLTKTQNDRAQQQGSGRSGGGWSGGFSSQGSALGLKSALGGSSSGVVGSGWSDIGSGRVQGAGGFSGCSRATAVSGGGFEPLRFSSNSGSGFAQALNHHPQQQQQQQQQMVSAPDSVLMKRDLNIVAGGAGIGSIQPQAAAAVVGVTGACHVFSAANAQGDAPMKVFKGRMSGAAAAIRAVKQQRLQQQHPGPQQQQQQQQRTQPHNGVASLATAASRSASASGSGNSSIRNFAGPKSGGPVQQQQQWQQQQQAADSELHVMPFEFKSGKEYFSHRAQVSLYLLLMEARYNLGQLPAGLLWNVHSPSMALVPSKHGELASLLACRNRLAAHLWQDVPVPPRMLGNADACARCHSAATCAAVHAVVDKGNAASSGMAPEQWSTLLGDKGVSAAAAAAWGAKWLQLIDWEEATARARKAELWALTGAERQAKGGCIAGLQLLGTDCTQPSSQGGEQLYLYTFRQLPAASSSNAGGCSVRTGSAAHAAKTAAPAAAAGGDDSSSSSSRISSRDNHGLLGMPVAPGDCLILGADGVQANVGRVDVVDVQGSTITVASRKALQLERYSSSAICTGAAGAAAVHAESSTIAQPAGQAVQQQRPPAGVTAVQGCSVINPSAGSTINASSTGGTIDASSTGGTMLTWRLDQDEAVSTGMQQRANVLRVAADSSSSRVIWLRRLIIDLDAPKQIAAAAATTQQTQMQAQQPGAAAAAGVEQATAAAVASLQADASAGAAVQLAMAAGRAYLEQHVNKLNCDQVAVLRRVLQMQDYSLVLGMPGTGKTSTIVHAVRALVASGASVLVTSYTNSALDNILLKLVECGVHDFLRIGRQSSCHPGVQDYLPGGTRYPQQTTTELQQLAASTPIVGCPCLSVHHPLLATRPAFDVVIVDEAGQISLPAVLGALLKARSFVLVGDHYQLPPLVLDKRASEGGLGVSLFRQLCEAHPAAVVVLAQQYRMCKPVMGLANELVYGGQLVAGSGAVEEATLELPRPERLQQCPSWVAEVLSPACQLAFINTDTILPAAAAQDHQTAGRSGVVNAGEAALLMQLLDGLLACGVPGSDVGMVSPYKAQVTLLQQLLAQRQSNSTASPAVGSAVDATAYTAAGSTAAAADSLGAVASIAAAAATEVEALTAAGSTTAAAGSLRGSAAAAEVEVLTIDRCQGRDKSVLLLSFVRSNQQGAVGTLLSDWQRLNVAITRAKVKLVMVGSARTLRGGVPLLAKLLEYVQREGKLVTLPRDALQQQQQQQHS